jgi:hypothetical protein
MGKHPLPSSAVHKSSSMELQRLYRVKSDLIASSNIIFVDKEHVQLKVEVFISPWCGCSVPRWKRKTKYCLPIIR